MVSSLRLAFTSSLSCLLCLYRCHNGLFFSPSSRQTLCLSFYPFIRFLTWINLHASTRRHQARMKGRQGKKFRQTLRNTDCICSYLMNESKQTFCDKHVKTPLRSASLNSLLWGLFPGYGTCCIRKLSLAPLSVDFAKFKMFNVCTWFTSLWARR